MGKKFEVVISGISGRFPESDDTLHLWKNLLDKKDLITNDDRRWQKGPPFPELPSATGKIKERDVMDMTFFGMNRRLCEVSDPHHRVSLETAFAAIVDAGVDPNDLWGSDTAVLATSVTSETEYECFMDSNRLSILGQSRCMQANRISNSLNFCGPSLMVDGSWNGAVDALAYASELIARGSVRCAVVVSCSVFYTAEVSYHYHRMGRLTPDGRTRPFDNNADGYNRSEGTAGFFLQRREDALRVYGTPVLARSAFRGSKEGPFTETSADTLRAHLSRFYSEAGLDPTEVVYVEANGAASKAVDAAELSVLAEVLGGGRPLLVGSVKSNLGHTEAASSAVGLTKLLLAANFGLIPPNINFSEPNREVPALLDGTLQVVTEATPVEGEYLALNNISITGGVGHVLVRRHARGKARRPERGVLPPDGLPRLFLISGRAEDGLRRVLAKVEESPIDEEFVALSNRVFKKGIKKHLYRGYTVLNDKGMQYTETKAFFTGSQDPRPMWWVFTGMGSQWIGMGRELMGLPVFARAVHNCHQILQPKGLDLLHIITTDDPTVFDSILHSFVGIAAIQIGLVDVLREVGLEPDGMIGHSVGELGCAYADGCFTAEQMILAAYARGKASIEAELIKGMMAAVGQGYKQIKYILPEGIEVACHNSLESCTLSGPADLMKKFIAELKEKGIFAKLVNVADIAYHSKYIRPAAPALLRYLKEVVPEPKPRSSKWISSSVPEKFWDREEARLCSPEYHTNNLLGAVLFEEACEHIPKEAVVVEIAPHGLLQAVLKRAFPAAVHVPLTNRTGHSLPFLFQALGKLYLEGYSLNIEHLYPPVEFPVSRGTPTLNDYVIYDHSEHWRVFADASLENPEARNSLKSKDVIVNLSKDEFKYLSEHVIYEQKTIPLSFYLDSIIKEFQKTCPPNTNIFNIRDIILNKHVELEKDIALLYISLGYGSGHWEVCQLKEKVTSGVITSEMYGPKNTSSPLVLGTALTGDQVYSHFSCLGLEVGPSFRLIKSATLGNQEVRAVVEWNGELAPFLDAVLMVPVLLEQSEHHLKIVSSLRQITIDLKCLNKIVNKELVVSYKGVAGHLSTEGLEATYPVCTPVKLTRSPEWVIISQELHFTPFGENSFKGLEELLETSIKILFSTMHDAPSMNIHLSVFEIQENLDISDCLRDVLKWRRDIQTNLKVASKDSSLDVFSADPEKEYVLFLTGSKQLNNSIRILGSARDGLILLKGQEPPQSLAVVLSTRIEGEPYYLCKLRRPFKEISECVIMNSPNWKLKLKSALLESNNTPIYLLGKEKSSSVIVNTTNECNKLFKSYLLRYIFIDVDISEFDLKTHIHQLEKDLKVNIFRDGKWGVELTRTLDISKPTVTEKQDIYSFSDIRCSNLLKLEAVSLNPTDVAEYTKKVEVFDYSGTIGGEAVCGLGTFSETSRTLCPDPVLQWKLPKNWSHEEACSVLMPYAMAYDMLVVEDYQRILIKPKSVLIHLGLLPLSQAAIRVALHKGMTIYTSYRTQQEKQKIMELFPEIPEKQLLDSSAESYFLPLLRMNGEGVTIVINTLPEPEFLKSCLHCIGIEGKLIQVSQRAIQEQYKIGMLVFMRSSSVEGISPLTIMKHSNEKKQIIQKLITEGFESGLIQPISNIVLPPSTTNIEAISMSSKTLDKKLVTRLGNQFLTNANGSHLYKANGSYILLADDEYIWLGIMELLIRRGASNIYLVVKNNKVTGFGSHKLRVLQQLNPHVNIVHTSDTRVKSHLAVQAFVDDVQTYKTLAAVFILGEEFASTVPFFSGNLKEEILVVVSENANALCEGRILDGLPTLGVSTPKDLQTYLILIPRLEKLLEMQCQNIFVTQQQLNHSTELNIEELSFIQHMPSTVREMLALAETRPAALWQEVKSSCPRSQACRELPPVFIIPPLKKGQMDSLIRALFHPTFIAVIPQQFNDFRDLAKQLYMGLEKFSTGVFTVICSDWSWVVGLLLGELLEAAGKEVSLIFFESSISWESPAAFQQVCSLVNKDMDLSNLSDQQRTKMVNKVEAASKCLKFRLDLFRQNLPEVKEKLKGICHYIRPNAAFKAKQLSKIQNYCKRQVYVFTSEENDFQKMMQDRRVHQQINITVLFEYKDAANKMEKVYMENGIFLNPRLSSLQIH